MLRVEDNDRLIRAVNYLKHDDVTLRAPAQVWLTTDTRTAGKAQRQRSYARP